jgi:hypothetical protein
VASKSPNKKFGYFLSFYVPASSFCLYHSKVSCWFPKNIRNKDINSQHGGPIRQPYLLYRPARLHRLAESIPRNRFLGSLNVYKYGLRQTEVKNLVWFGEIERKLAKLSMTTFTYRFSSNYFMDEIIKTHREKIRRSRQRRI